MTFNIRYGTAPDGPHRWERRRALVIERIRAFQPDLLGVQECRADAQARFMRAHLRDYACYGVPRGGMSESALEMAPAWYRRASFELVDQGHFWLSETPETPGSVSWGGALPRTAVWVKLQQRVSGQQVLFVNTHFDYQPDAIAGAARLLQHWLAPRVRQTPVIVTGDFNATKTSSAHQALTGEAALVDAVRHAHPDAPDPGTFHGFGEAIRQPAIDWILASAHFDAVEAAVDRHTTGGYPSDHYPVTAVLRWKTNVAAHDTR